MFSSEEKKQYSRHFILNEIGISGQEKLKKAKILVIGAGGLGCPVLQYLTAAGIGTIGIIDNDTVTQSNLQRQILFTYNDIGKPKVLCAKKRLEQINPFIKFNTYQVYLNSENALDLFEQYDIIVDGSDNFQTRYLTNDAAVLSNKPLVFGAIFKFEGQISVFNYKNGPTYRCLFPEPPKANSIPNCSDIGVMGVLPGIVGCYQANEVIKIICGIGEVLSGKLLSLNTLNLQQNLLNFKKNNTIQINKLIDYAIFCGTEDKYIEIDSEELKEKLVLENIVLIDVRKTMEREHFNIGGLHIPLHQLQQKLEELKEADNIVFYCQVGQRSLLASKILKEKYPNKKSYSLKGGITSWIETYS